jgi:hypothetical protein
MDDELTAGAESGPPPGSVHHMMMKGAQRNSVAQIRAPAGLPWLEMMHLAVPGAERAAREPAALIASEHGPALRGGELPHRATVIDNPLIGHEESLEDAVAGEH